MLSRDNIDIVGENYDGQLVDFSVEDNCYVNDKFIGTTVAKKITVNILNPNNSINLENKRNTSICGNKWRICTIWKLYNRKT